MNTIRAKINDGELYGASWGAFFIAHILGIAAHEFWLTWVPYWIVLPVSFVLVWTVLGSWLEKHSGPLSRNASLIFWAVIVAYLIFLLVYLPIKVL